VAVSTCADFFVDSAVGNAQFAWEIAEIHWPCREHVKG
jgi:hypothetical protein